MVKCFTETIAVKYVYFSVILEFLTLIEICFCVSLEVLSLMLRSVA